MRVEIRDQANSVRFIVKDDTTQQTVTDFSVKKRELNSFDNIPAELDENSRSFVESVLNSYREIEGLGQKYTVRKFPATVREVIEFCNSEQASDHERTLMYQVLYSGFNSIKKIQRERAMRIEPSTRGTV